jgi:hypothetical protein
MRFIIQLAHAILPEFLWARILDLRIRQRALQVERICLHEMVASSSNIHLAPPTRNLTNGAILQRIVLIADVMWENYELVPELTKICSVQVHDVRPVINQSSPENLRTDIARNIEQFIVGQGNEHPDLVLLYLPGSLLSEELFATLRSNWSCPLVGWNLDDRVSFWNYDAANNHDHYQKWATFFDLNLTNAKLASTWYHQAGAACIYMPAGVHLPAGMGPPTRAYYQYPLSFLGSPKLDRVALVNRLCEVGLPVTVFGRGWPNTAWVDSTSSVYRASQINLGMGMATLNFSTTKNRDFECPGVGACYMTTYNWELPEWWELGREILCYRNVEELIEMVCWYRNRPDECLKIAQAAWHRCAREHTWEIRFRKIFRELGFSV